MEERPSHEFHPNSYSGTPPCSSVADHRPNFPGDAYPNHHHHHYQQHYYNSNNYQQQHPHDGQFNNNNHYPQPHPHPMNNDHNESFSGGGFRSNGGGGYASAHPTHFNGRKRGFHNPGRGPSQDRFDGCGHTKLYVTPIPRTATVEDIRPVFEAHGNVVEVVLFKDKRTGQQQGSCFVKYATLEDAEQAIKALNNQHTFSGEMSAIKVRFAERERERLVVRGQQEFAAVRGHQEFAPVRVHQESAAGRGHQQGVGGVVDKLYVGSVNRQASAKDIEEIFSQFGVVEDVFIVRDEQKQSRGCAFVKFSRREMALAAIKALNGTFTMRGCDQPLIVRFATPKKPRFGEMSGNHPYGGSNLGLRAQEPGFRSASSLGDSSQGCIPPNAAYPALHNFTSPNLQAVSQMPNQEAAAPLFTQQTSQLHQSPSQLSQMPLQQTQSQDKGSQSSQHAGSEMHKQSHFRPSTQTLEQQHIMQNSKQESPQNGSLPQAVASPLLAVPASPQTAAPLECDWSEHTCPDGDKYYYNCVTWESRWEKPEEFTLFEKQLQKQQQLHNPSKPLQSLSPDLSTQEVVQMQQVPDHVELQSKENPVVGSICV